MNKYKNASGVSGGTFQNHNPERLQPNYSLNPLNRLLEQAENVRYAGEGYRADCPNGHRSRGSLAIKESDEGSVLLHCHSGCSSLEVLHGLGLEMKDLFPQQNINRMSPQERKEYSQKVQYSAMISALELVPPEMTIVACVGVDLSKGKRLDLADHKRLGLAIQRVNTAIQYMINMKAVLRGS
jgi:hypothetical protein